MSSPAYGQSNKDNDGATGRLIRIICHRVSPVALKLKLNTYSKVVLLSLHIHPFVVIASCNATLSIGQLGPFASSEQMLLLLIHHIQLELIICTRSQMRPASLDKQPSAQIHDHQWS